MTKPTEKMSGEELLNEWVRSILHPSLYPGKQGPEMKAELLYRLSPHAGQRDEICAECNEPKSKHTPYARKDNTRPLGLVPNGWICPEGPCSSRVRTFKAAEQSGLAPASNDELRERARLQLGCVVCAGSGAMMISWVASAPCDTCKGSGVKPGVDLSEIVAFHLSELRRREQGASVKVRELMRGGENGWGAPQHEVVLGTLQLMIFADRKLAEQFADEVRSQLFPAVRQVDVEELVEKMLTPNPETNQWIRASSKEYVADVLRKALEGK